jgi:hypothetical protein
MARVRKRRFCERLCAPSIAKRRHLTNGCGSAWTKPSPTLGREFLGASFSTGFGSTMPRR